MSWEIVYWLLPAITFGGPIVVSLQEKQFFRFCSLLTTIRVFTALSAHDAVWLFHCRSKFADDSGKAGQVQSEG